MDPDIGFDTQACILEEYLALIDSIVEPESVNGLIFKPVNECMTGEGRRYERLGAFIALDRKG
jgi:hypothetical protein